jgi:hypothetical protein
MDARWKTTAEGMSMTAAIAPQSALNDTSFFATTNVLIISSGVIDIPQNRIDNIKLFLMRGKPVYLQCEYLSTYQSNQAFASLVNSLGGVFTWGSTVSGTLAPMEILGTLATTPNNVPSISYFWYGVYGTGNSTIENFMRYQSNYFGFVFTPPNANYGIIISDTDQDWVNQSTSIPLMQNILYRLSHFTTGIKQINNNIPQNYILYQNFPNPFNPATKIDFNIAKSSDTKLIIYDMLGKEIAVLVNEHLQPGKYQVDWDGSHYTSGTYFYKLISEDYTITKKMMLLK